MHIASTIEPHRHQEAATDPIQPVHDFNIPIPSYKHPPVQQDFPRNRRRREAPDQPSPAQPPATGEDGHVDDYA